MSEPHPTPGGERLLDGLDAVDWPRLHHAFGSAGEVPGLLRSLLSPEPAQRIEALKRLYETICHQGTVYEATPYAVPFLAALVASPLVEVRPELVLLLHAIATGTSYLDVHEHSQFFWRKRLSPGHLAERARELEWVRAGREAVGGYTGLYLALLADPGEELRMTVPVLLTELPHEGRIVAALLAACRGEQEPRPKACMILALLALTHQIPAETQAAERAAVVGTLRGWLNDASQGALIRSCCAIALVSLASPELRDEAFEVFHAEVAGAEEDFRKLPVFDIRDPEDLRSRGYSHEEARRCYGSDIYEATGWFAHASGSPEAKAAFYLQMLRHPSAGVRASAIYGAYNFCHRVRSAPAVLAPHIGALLADENEQVRTRAMHNIPNLGKAGRETLEALLGSERPEVQTAAKVALEKVAEHQRSLLQPAPPFPVRPLSSWIAKLSATGRGSVALRMGAARALEAMGSAARPALPALHRALIDSDFQTCVSAACTIWKLEGDPSILPLFLEILEEEPKSPEVFRALGEMGAAAAPAVPLLRAFVESAERPPLLSRCPIWLDEHLCAAAAAALELITGAMEISR